MPSYTAVLTATDDGSYRAFLPAIPSVTGHGPTRAGALEHITSALQAHVDRLSAQGEVPPREEWSPVRTVWVRNPRRGDSVPYVVAVQATASGRYRAMPLEFPDIRAEAETIDAALELAGPLIFERLTALVAQGLHFPTQDDQQAYVIRAKTPTRSG